MITLAHVRAGRLPLPQGHSHVSEELVPKYEEWVRRLEANLEGLERERRNMKRVLIVATVVSPLGFIWNKWIAIAIFSTGVILFGTTIYITSMRKYQYKAELKRTLAEIDRLREA